MKKHFTLLIVLLFIHYLSHAQSTFSLQSFSTGYTAPVAIENANDSRLFIVQQSGQIIICDSTGKKLATPFLDISKKITYNGERGLLGLAFDPNYSSNRYFYVYYIDTNGNTQVSRYKVALNTPDIAIASSEYKLLNIPQPFTNHKGGCIHFSPVDGYLYIGTGDGGSGGDPNNNAQNPQSLLGKILRIDVHKTSGNLPYAIPPNNPFVNSSGYRTEIWALGLRNPWRWSFDTENGYMIIGDVGQDAWEEVDFQSKVGGKNYGWRCYEGNHAYNTSGCMLQASYQAPVYEYPHSGTTGDCSIIGGYIYRGKANPDLSGKYIFADYCSGIIRALRIKYPGADLRDTYNSGFTYAFTTFGEDSKLELYIANEANGTIYSIKYGTTGNKVAVSVAPAFTVAPNPSQGSFNVNYKSNKTQQVIIHIQNMIGQQFYASKTSLNAGNNNLNLNVRIPHGDYVITITDASGKTTNQRLQIE